jgi:hypothetical protein
LRAIDTTQNKQHKTLTQRKRTVPTNKTNGMNIVPLNQQQQQQKAA